jgi:hypothetical protein
MGVALLSVAAAGCASSVPTAADEGATPVGTTDAGAPKADAAVAGPVALDAATADARADAPPAPAAPAADAAAPGAAAGCQTDNDCVLISDCCACLAIKRGEKATTCDPNRSCVMSVCAQYQGVDRARCSAGRCVLGFDCTSSVLCKRLPPICPQGQVPQVVNGCYGECVETRQCATVTSCVVCRSTDLCVRTVAAPAGLHCHAPLTANLVGEK